MIYVIYSLPKNFDNEIMGIWSKKFDNRFEIVQHFADDALSLTKANQSKGWDAKPLA